MAPAGSSDLPRPVSSTEVLLVALVERIDALIEAVGPSTTAVTDEPAATSSPSPQRRPRKRTERA